MNKKLMSVVAALLSLVILLGCAPVSFAEPSVLDTSDLIYAISLAPEKSTWDKYVSTEKLESDLQWADVVLSSAAESTVSQEVIDYCTMQLLETINGLSPHATGLTISPKTKKLPVGSSFTLTAAMQPENAGDKVVWSSSNSSIVKVSQKGVAQALKYSKNPVTIKATANKIEQTCLVTLTNPLNSVGFKASSVSIYKTKTATLSAKAYGKDKTCETTDKVSWSWKSSDTSVARVTTQGVVAGVSTGSCTVTATATCGSVSRSATCTVNVNDFKAVKSLQPITVSPTSGVTLTVGESTTYRVGILPTNASNKNVKWVSSDDKILKVTPTGTSNAIAGAALTAVAPGSATLTYMAADGSGATGKLKVTVKPLVSSVSFSETNVVLLVKGTKQLTAKVLPADAGNQLLDWSSSDSSICSVDYKGQITAKKLGICTIYAKTKDGTALTVSCNVRVASQAESLSLTKTRMDMKSGQTYRLYATVLTVDNTTYTSCNEVSWKSSDKSIATVTSAGTVRGKLPGTVKITATAKDGSGVSSSCTVSVTAPVKGVSLKEKMTLGLGKSTTVTPTFDPVYATNKSVTWKSSDKTVATVSSSGKITAKKIGKTVITCTTKDGGYKASCTLTVVVPVVSLSLNKTTASLKTGKTLKLTAEISPSNATNQKINWSSSNKKIATVSSTGTVTALAPGKVTITAKSADGGVKKTCTVTCIRPVTGISMKSTLKGYEGQKVSLGAKVVPSDASNQKMTFTSSKTSVVAVNKTTGALTLKKAGSATITAKTAEGGFTAKCRVIVGGKISVTSLKIGSTSLKLNVGATADLKPVVEPSDASDKSIKWTSSKTSVATVSSKGIVSAKGPGTAVIKGVTNDGGFTVQCTVKVRQPLKGISLQSPAITMNVGTKFTAKVSFNPVDASNKAVTWSTSDKTVVTVKEGVLTAKKPGTATIKCKSAEGDYVASCTVTVLQPVTGIKLSKTSLKLNMGNDATLRATVIPENASNSQVTWKSSNRLVASVNSKGVVSTSLMTGTAVITATTKDGGFTATCTVKVVQPVTSITLGVEELYLDAGKTKTITATVQPSNATDPDIVWKSTNTKVATVSEKGTVTAVSGGTARIVASSEDGYCSAYCNVTVKQTPTKVTLSLEKKSLNVGGTVKLTAKVYPEEAYDKSIKWTSSNTAIAKVDQKGVVTALKAGTATVTCRTLKGSCSASCRVTVKVLPTSVKLNRTKLTLYKGKASTLVATVYPADATNKAVSWSSSNTNVVKVSSNGKVTAVALGSATVTATTKDGKKKASCFVTVPQPVTGIKISKTSATVGVGRTLKLTGSVTPASATFDDVRWSTSNPDIATVTQEGLVTALTPGTVTISIKSVDGGFKKTCTVKVVKLVVGVDLNYTSKTLTVGKTLTLRATVAPASASNRDVTWSSNNKTVATVNSAGVVTAKAPGTAVITVKTADGGFTEKCTVTVKSAS